MIELFEMFKKKMYLYQTLFWVISWAVTSIVINGIGVVFLGVEYGNTDSSFTNMYSLISIGMCLYIATIATRKFRTIQYTRWLSKNMNSSDSGVNLILYKLVSKNLIEYKKIHNSQLPSSEQDYIFNFTPTSDDYKNTAKQDLLENPNAKSTVYVVPNIYNTAYITLGLILSSAIPIFALFIINKFFSFNLDETLDKWIFFIILFGGMTACLILLFKKLESFKQLISSKALMSVDKEGIRFRNYLYEWENVVLPNNLLSLKDNVDPRNPIIEFDFRYLEETVNVNLKSISALEVYDAIIVNGIHFEEN